MDLRNIRPDKRISRKSDRNARKNLVLILQEFSKHRDISYLKFQWKHILRDRRNVTSNTCNDK